MKVITFADEGIFNGAPTDVGMLKQFIFSRSDMNYPIFIDNNHVAYNGMSGLLRRAAMLNVYQRSSSLARTSQCPSVSSSRA